MTYSTPVHFMLSLMLASSFALTQQTKSVSPRRATGTVTGHIYCADTNAPARMAKVTLEPVRDLDPAKLKPTEQPQVQAFTVEQATLDGSFIFSKVSPGSYYVLAEQNGYLSPLAQFSDTDLYQPSKEMAQKVAKVVQKVTVQANQTADVSVRLERGAAVSGTVRYDDGSPAPSLTVQVLRKQPDGKWAGLQSAAPNQTLGLATTDDLGGFRIAGLPAAVYIAKANLTLTEMLVSNVLGQSSSSSSNNIFTLPIFSGGGVRERDAVSFKLTAGDERGGEDIVIPIAKLHSVSGSIVAAHDGHLINAGTLVLLHADDESQAASTEVAKDDTAFHFAFVPEGEYILQVTGARDVLREEIPSPPGYMPSTHMREKSIHAYKGAEQRITVRGDLSNLVISVSEPKAQGANGAE